MVASTAALGAQNIALTGSDDSGTRTVDFALTVTVPPMLTLTASSSRLGIARGRSARVKLTAATGGSFTGSISLVAHGLPAGVTAAWSVNPITPVSGVSVNSVWLTLAAISRAGTGSYSVEIVAAGDGVVSSTALTLQVAGNQGCALPRLRLPCVKPTPVKPPDR
jgi:hypothetical protein